ncbi:MAG TPA: cupredoxin family copper-binding protein [Gemmatimonadales bacterium]|nr:cupredoxin family copper-binding protein [Gemmatimonadales bacterium]
MILRLVLLLATSPASKTHTVEIRGMEFHPAELTVAVGDTIEWVNRDIVPHTATASGHSKWDTGALTQDKTGRYVAQRAGVVRYSCTFHPTMHGKLTVR